MSYKISHVFSEITALRSQPWRKAVVHYIMCDPAEHIPPGDFDLLADNKIIRLKHTTNDPMACAFVECVNASQFRTKDNLIITVTKAVRSF